MNPRRGDALLIGAVNPFRAKSAAMTDLEQVADRLFWWKTPAEALADTQRFLAQVLVFGRIEDLIVVRQPYSDDDLRAVLRSPPPGVFDPRSWSYWHLVLGMGPAPELPQRDL